MSNPGRNRNTTRLTPKEEKWLLARAEGKSPLEAAIEAGYSNPHDAAWRNKNSKSLVTMNRAVLAAGGIDLPRITEILNRLLDAKKLVKATFEGKITDEMWVEDGDIQLRAIEVVIDLAGLRPSDEQRFFQEDETEGTGFSIPEKYRDMSQEDLLLKMQRRRQALLTGTVIEDDSEDTLADDSA